MSRSKTRALQRQSKAVSLFREGHTFDQIAHKVGYANRGTAHRMVTNAYKDRMATDIDFHRDMEVERLDAIQARLWDIMTTGDRPADRVRAADAIVKVIAQRAKILGLYDHTPQEPVTLVNARWAGSCTCNTGEATPDR